MVTYNIECNKEDITLLRYCTAREISRAVQTRKQRVTRLDVYNIDRYIDKLRTLEQKLYDKGES